MTSLLEGFRAAFAGGGGRARLGPDVTLEHILTAPDLANFAPSPAQLALVRAADGAPLDGVLSPERMRFHFGCEELPNARPTIVVPRTGVRAGKSLIAALGGMLTSILRSDFSNVRSGELVRALIVAPRLAVSGAPFHHLCGTMKASATLAPMLLKPGAESCVIRRPDGREVTVQLVAASSGGLNLRSTWLAGVIFDEADFHQDESGAVNLPDNLRAAMPRLLPGAQCWVPSSPWADVGPYHEMFTEAFGKPGHTLAFHSDSRSMNPTLSLEDEAAERARDPDNAAREYDAIPLSANSAQFFPLDAIAAAFNPDRPLVLQPILGVQHYGGSDLGFRKNSSALAIVRDNPETQKIELAYHEELRPQAGAPLKPSVVCKSFGKTCRMYDVDTVRGDLHYAESAREHLDSEGVGYDEWNPSGENQTAAFTALKNFMQERRVDLPNDPRLKLQMTKAMRAVGAGGVVRVLLPKQGMAHGDVLMAVALAYMQVPPEPIRYESFRVRSGRQ